MFSGSTCAALKFYCAIMSRAAKTLSSSIHTDYRAKRTAWKASFFSVAACELALVSYILISASSWQTHLLHSDTVKSLQWAVNVKSFLIITFFLLLLSLLFPRIVAELVSNYSWGENKKSWFIYLWCYVFFKTFVFMAFRALIYCSLTSSRLTWITTPWL